MSSKASTVNKTLTNYARGIAQDSASALAEFIAPTVRTGVAHGQYKSFNDKNAFQVYDTSRAIGGTARRIEFEADDPRFNCKPQALEITIDDHERDLAGDNDDLGLEEAKIDTLISSCALSHEAKVFTAIKNAVAAVVGKGQWSDASVDPVKQLNEQITAIAIATGRMPNRIAFGLGAWNVFVDHPKVIERQPGAALIGVTAQQAAKMLLNPAIEIRVGVLSMDTNKFGKDKNAVNIVGADIYLFYASQNPTTYDPSFAKTFMTKRGGVDSVRQYREESASSDVYAIHWSEDIQVVSTECVRRLTLS